MQIALLIISDNNPFYRRPSTLHSNIGRLRSICWGLVETAQPITCFKTDKSLAVFSKEKYFNLAHGFSTPKKLDHHV